MPGLIIWKNQEINKLRRDMDRLFNRVWCEFCLPPSPPIVRMAPYMDLSETEDRLIIKAKVPGIKPDDLDISISDDVLIIKGEIRQDLVKAGGSHRRAELKYGSFSRTIQLPCRIEIEDVKATYKKGVLNIVMPKCKSEKSRTVKIELK